MYDTDLVLKSAGLVASTAAASNVLDLGSALWEGVMVINATAIEVNSNDELFTIALQGSPTSGFTSSVVNLAMMELGALEALAFSTADADSVTGLYVLPVNNLKGGSVYRYLRAYTKCGGTVSTGINYSAWLADNWAVAA